VAAVPLNDGQKNSDWRARVPPIPLFTDNEKCGDAARLDLKAASFDGERHDKAANW